MLNIAVGVAGMALAAEGSIYFSASYDRMSWDEASSHCATLHPKAHLMYPANQEKWWSYKKLLCKFITVCECITYHRVCLYKLV